MARIRITTGVLEYLLDLPEGVRIVGGTTCIDFVGEDSTPVLSFNVTGPAPFDEDDDDLFALQYEETEDGVHLVAVIPVPE
jgi:hypothetical protein